MCFTVESSAFVIRDIPSHIPKLSTSWRHQSSMSWGILSLWDQATSLLSNTFHHGCTMAVFLLVLVFLIVYCVAQGEYFSMRCQISAAYDEWPQAMCLILGPSYYTRGVRRSLQISHRATGANGMANQPIHEILPIQATFEDGTGINTTSRLAMCPCAQQGQLSLPQEQREFKEGHQYPC